MFATVLGPEPPSFLQAVDHSRDGVGILNLYHRSKPDLFVRKYGDMYVTVLGPRATARVDL